MKKFGAGHHRHRLLMDLGSQFWHVALLGWTMPMAHHLSL